MTNALKVVFAGTPEFGLPCLEAIQASKHHLLAVYTQPDRPAGRGRKLQASPIKQWALTQELPVYQPLNFKAEEDRETLAALKPDVVVVIAYGLLLPQSVLDIPKYACINVHASLLPRWRGASPIQQAILHGDPQSGVTIMQMDAGLDTGNMLNRASCEIGKHDSAGDLHDQLAKISAAPLIETLDQIEKYLAEGQKQDDAQATYAPKISKAQAKIDWQKPAIEIDRQIRAFSPWPIAYTEVDGTTLRIHQAKVLMTESNHPAGTIIDIQRNHLVVATTKQALAIEKLQFPGSKVITVSDWINAGQPHLTLNMILK